MCIMSKLFPVGIFLRNYQVSHMGLNHICQFNFLKLHKMPCIHYFPKLHKPCSPTAYFWNVMSQIARFTCPTCGPLGPCRSQVGPMLAPWTLLSGVFPILVICCLTSQMEATLCPFVVKTSPIILNLCPLMSSVPVAAVLVRGCYGL